ncbi:MAG: TRASH domain-containing protein [Pyrobaculum sp.]
MPFELKVAKVTELRCTNCGRIIQGAPIVVKTCCVNKPWVFCSRECQKQFTMKWTRNQDAGRGGVLRRGIV